MKEYYKRKQDGHTKGKKCDDISRRKKKNLIKHYTKNEQKENVVDRLDKKSLRKNCKRISLKKT